MFGVVPAEETRQNARASTRLAKRSGKSGRYFRVRNYGWMLKLSASDSGGTKLLYMLTRSTGGRLFDEKGKSMLDTPEVKRASEYLIEVAQTASGPGQLNYNINDNFGLINAGKTVLSEDSAAVVATAYKEAPQVAEKLACAVPKPGRTVCELVVR